MKTDILVDGNQVGYLRREETKEFVISHQAHKVSFIRKTFNNDKGYEEIKIADLPPSFLDWHIHIGCWTNFFSGQAEVEITEDQAQTEYNKRAWNKYLIEKENKK